MATKKTATKKTAAKKKAAKKTAVKKTAVKKTATKKTTGRSATTTSTETKLTATRTTATKSTAAKKKVAGKRPTAAAAAKSRTPCDDPVGCPRGAIKPKFLNAVPEESRSIEIERRERWSELLPDYEQGLELVRKFGPKLMKHPEVTGIHVGFKNAPPTTTVSSIHFRNLSMDTRSISSNGLTRRSRTQCRQHRTWSLLRTYP